MKIGFMGGTFSPPHKGHLHSAEVFYRETGLDLLIIIPAKVSPFKTDSQMTASDRDRFEMTKLCFSSLGDKGMNVRVSDMELSRQGTSYTVDTVKTLRELYPDDSLYMFVGSDMFISLERWKNFKDIFSQCTVYTRSRLCDEEKTLEKTKALYEEKYGADIVISNDEELIISSTFIREKIAERCFEKAENLLTDNVLRYIIENRLYF